MENSDEIWFDKQGRLKRDNPWLRYHVTCANSLDDDFIVAINTRHGVESTNVDDTFANFYSKYLPRVYRVQDLKWFTPWGLGPHARLVFAIPPATKVQTKAHVIFRLDRKGIVCAHAYNIAVTQPMLDFAKRMLRAMPCRAQQEYEEAGRAQNKWLGLRGPDEQKKSTVKKQHSLRRKKPKRKAA